MPAGLETSIQVMNRLCKYIYANDNSGRLRTRAILSHMYHYALHDDWFRARDLLLMSHLQETINHSDPSTQVNIQNQHPSSISNTQIVLNHIILF